MILKNDWSRPRPFLLGPVLLAMLVTGCEQGNPTVSGIVVYEDDSTPLDSGMVMFLALEGGKRHARGDIQTDGTYQLGTKKPGDGTAPGKYRVCIVPPDRSAEVENGIRVPPLVDSRYLDVRTSGLEFEVKPGHNEFTIKVSKPAG